MSDEKELKDQRIPIMMTESEVAAIDDWSFKHRIRSRGEAIRRLCQIGLVFDENRSEIFDSVTEMGTRIGDALVSLEDRIYLRKENSTDDSKAIIAIIDAWGAYVKIGKTLKLSKMMANDLTDKDIEKVTEEVQRILASEKALRRSSKD